MWQYLLMTYALFAVLRLDSESKTPHKFRKAGLDTSEVDWFGMISEMEGVFDVDLLHKHIAEQQRRLENAKHMYEAFKSRFEDASQTAEQLRTENATLKSQLSIALGRMATAVRRDSRRKCIEDEGRWLSEIEKIQNMIQIAGVDAEMLGLDWKRRRHAAMNPSMVRLQRSLVSAQQHLSLIRARLQDIDHIEQMVHRLCVSARKGDTEVVMRLVDEEGLSVHETDEAGLNALHYAAMGGHCELVQALLAQGADVQGVSTDHAPVVLAAKYGHTQVVQLLLGKGAIMNAVDATGLTPLASCTAHGHIETMRLLIQLGADVNTQDVEGNTALHIAINQRRLNAIQLLLENRADTMIENIQGNDAKKAALSTQDETIIATVKPFIHLTTS